MGIYYPRALVVLSFVLDHAVEADLRAVLSPAAMLALKQNQSFAMIPSRDVTRYVVGVVPRSVRVTKNSYREADKAVVVFDWGVFPFDPRLARAISVDIHLASMTGPWDPIEPGPETLIFVGYADEGKYRVGGDSTITLEARDHTALLADQRFGGKEIDLARPLSEILGEMLGAAEATSTMEVEIRGDDIVLGDQRGEEAQTFGAETTRSVWDVITSLVAEAGLVAWVDGKTLVVGPSQTLAGDESGTAFIHGVNLKDIEIARHVGRKKTPPVILKCWDPGTRSTLSATWPKPEDAPEEKTGSGEKAGSKALIYTISSITDQRALERAARAVWTRRAQQDVMLRLDTHEMVGPGGESLLGLKAGSPVSVVIGESEVGNLHALGMAERRRRLLELGYEGSVATAIAAAYDEISPLYQVVKAEHSLEEKAGYRLSLECASYITASG